MRINRLAYYLNCSSSSTTSSTPPTSTAFTLLRLFLMRGVPSRGTVAGFLPPQIKLLLEGWASLSGPRDWVQNPKQWVFCRLLLVPPVAVNAVQWYLTLHLNKLVATR